MQGSHWVWRVREASASLTASGQTANQCAPCPGVEEPGEGTEGGEGAREVGGEAGVGGASTDNRECNSRLRAAWLVSSPVQKVKGRALTSLPTGSGGSRSEHSEPLAQGQPSQGRPVPLASVTLGLFPPE